MDENISSPTPTEDSPDLLHYSLVNNRYSRNPAGLGYYSHETENLFSRGASHCQHTDWDLCEMVRLQELGEARQRAAQMEKTMRWWSECTASWRDKWNTVRMERNRAREDANMQRKLLKQAQEELSRLYSSKRYVNGESTKTSPFFQAPPPSTDSSHQTVEAPETTSSETQTDEIIKEGKSAERSKSPTNNSLSFSQLATEVEILTAKCEELEAAKDAAFDDVEQVKKYYKEKLGQTQHHLDATTFELERVQRENSEFQKTIEILQRQLRQNSLHNSIPNANDDDEVSETQSE
uniref:Coiled-coil domain-containing protein 102A n=1 Tax=Panagrolaimus sp. PS1159 TaxID=55785 RepID=A0AC35F994_9BILA